jgi:hypothetical protein
MVPMLNRHWDLREVSALYAAKEWVLIKALLPMARATVSQVLAAVRVVRALTDGVAMEKVMDRVDGRVAQPTMSTQDVTIRVVRRDGRVEEQRGRGAVDVEASVVVEGSEVESGDE